MARWRIVLVRFASSFGVDKWYILIDNDRYMDTFLASVVLAYFESGGAAVKWCWKDDHFCYQVGLILGPQNHENLVQKKTQVRQVGESDCWAREAWRWFCGNANCFVLAFGILHFLWISIDDDSWGEQRLTKRLAKCDLSQNTDQERGSGSSVWVSCVNVELRTPCKGFSKHSRSWMRRRSK